MAGHGGQGVVEVGQGRGQVAGQQVGHGRGGPGAAIARADLQGGAGLCRILAGQQLPAIAGSQ